MRPIISPNTLNIDLFHPIINTFLILIFSVFCGVYVSNTPSLAVILIIFSFYCLLFIYELKYVASGKRSSLLIPFIIFTLPFQRVVFYQDLYVSLFQLFSIVFLVSQIILSKEKIRKKNYLKIRPLILPIVVFCFVYSSSYLFSSSVTFGTLQELFNTISSTSYVLIASIYVNSEKDIMRILKLLILIGTLQVPIIIAQSLGWLDFINLLKADKWMGVVNSGTTYIRFGGSFGDSELLAEYLSILILISIGMLLFFDYNRSRFYLIISLVILFVGGFLTGTRSFLVSTSIGIIILMVLTFFQAGLYKRVSVIIGIILLFVVLTMTLFSNQLFSGYFDRFLYIQQEAENQNYLNRWNIFQSIVELAMRKPILGYGANYKTVLSSLYGKALKSPHTFYLGMLLIAGFPGLISSILLAITPIILGIKLLVRKGNILMKKWGILIVSTFTLWAINEIKIDFLRYSFYMDLIFFIIGIVSSVYVYSTFSVKQTER